MIKKALIAASLTLAFSAQADKFVIVVDQVNNKYEIKESYDEVTYGEWSELSRDCNYNIMDSTIYFDKSFNQQETCDVTQERTIYTTTNYPDNTKSVVEGSEESIIQEINDLLSTGTYVASSCLIAHNFDSTLIDGLYTLNISGQNEIMYCDMTNGGFTLVSHIYDRDNRDDILNNSNGAGWGSLNNTPNSDTSFNLANAKTPVFTESVFEWDYPFLNEKYRHKSNVLNLTTERFAWVHPNPSTSIYPWNLVSDLEIDQNGYRYGVFGVHTVEESHPEVLGFLPQVHGCGGGQILDKAIHYWGYGSVIAYGNNSTYELHNIDLGLNVSVGNGTGCGTKDSILNIWVK